MTALHIQDGIDNQSASTAPEPLQRLFQQAGLASPPASMRELRFDTDWGSHGQRKIVMAFTIDRADTVWFTASSPALHGTTPTPSVNRFGPVLAVVGKKTDESGDDAGAGPPAETDFPWWRPRPVGTGRRWAYSTPDFDFVEVIINDRDGCVHLRAIN